MEAVAAIVAAPSRPAVGRIVVASLVGLAAFVFFAFLSAPAMSWVNADHDVADTLWSTRVFGLQHPTGAPLYTLLGWLVSRGSPTWDEQAHRLAVALSAFPAAIIAAILSYRTRGILAAMLLMASGVFLSQAIVPKYYPLVALFVLLQWLTKRTPWFWPVSLAGIAVHHIPGMAFLFLVVWRWRHGESVWPTPLVLLGTLGVYWSYWRFAAQPPTLVGWKDVDFLRYMGGQRFLFMGLSPYPFGPFMARLRDAALMIPASLGLGLLLLRWSSDRWLLALAGLLALHYLTELDPHTYTYLTPAIVLAILAACEADLPWDAIPVRILAAMVAGGMMLWNVSHYDIGRNLDPSPTVAQQVYAQFAALPDGSIVDSKWVGPWDFMPFLFNGRIITRLDDDPRRAELIPTVCATEMDMDRLWAHFVPRLLNAACD